MRKQTFSIRLDQSQIEAIAKIAKIQGRKRSAIHRQLLDQALQNENQTAA